MEETYFIKSMLSNVGIMKNHAKIRVSFCSEGSE